MDKMEVIKDTMKRPTDSHLDALYEAMDKLMSERMDALENDNENEKRRE
jgi:hypothetical protein